MNGNVTWFRRTVSVWLSAAILGVAVAVPLLERADLVHEPVMESEHNPATCPPAHDHTVCTTVAASFAAPSSPVERHQPHGLTRIALPVDAPEAVHSAIAEGHPSRAPPLA